MSEAHRAIARMTMDEVWSKGNLDSVEELYAADHVGHSAQGPELRGHQEFAEYVSMYRSAFPDLTFRIEDTIAEGDRVAMRWQAAGTQQGDLPGIPATGKAAAVTGTTFLRMAEGKIAESWVSWDALGLFQALGTIPAGEQPQGSQGEPHRPMHGPRLKPFEASEP